MSALTNLPFLGYITQGFDNFVVVNDSNEFLWTNNFRGTSKYHGGH